MLQKCEGIVIRTNHYGESNKIVTIYSREFGKIGLMARGAKKPNSRLSAISQLFTYGYFLFIKGSGLGTLQQGEMAESLRHVREDLFKTAYATYIVDLLDKATEDRKPNPFLFELLYKTLHYLNEDYDPEILMHIFEMKMLPVLGLYPTLNGCAVCGESDGEFAFSFKENGFICHRCLSEDPHHLPISQGTVKLLRVFYYFDLNRLGNISVKDETKHQLKRVIRTYYDENSGLTLKSRRFLDQMDNLKDLF
ncbi:DNA repair protein RecO [Rossellomorea arthrocnemi]|jgi:DNA repair protein RecO (recombination protein O)|uniref:DNA repair protein RecO n=1 Tax=Rossellomorea arthrocnemi TaxID=2769542 RepID=UPI0019194EF8|nr:DNA repair protein RecO [Rossellomorea arthrocnemi]